MPPVLPAHDRDRDGSSAEAGEEEWDPRQSHLMQVLHSGGQIVSDPAHGLQRRLIEIGWLSIYHLHDHDAQRPDVHLQRQGRERA